MINLTSLYNYYARHYFTYANKTFTHFDNNEAANLASLSTFLPYADSVPHENKSPIEELWIRVLKRLADGARYFFDHQNHPI